MSGGGTITNATSLTNAVITFPALTSSEQTIEVRLTATDALGATATDTVNFTVPTGDPPETPVAPDLTTVSSSSIRASITDPTSDLAITQRDIRWRRDGTLVWDTRSDVMFPYTITGLMSGSEYEVQVQVRSAAGTSGWSVSARETTGHAGPTVTITTTRKNRSRRDRNYACCFGYGRY